MAKNVADWQKFPATIENYDQIKDYIIVAAEQAGISARRRLKLELGFEEVIINVINYAYESEGDIFIRCSNDEKIFSLDIVDYGTPFNPIKKNDARTLDKSAIEDRKIGGFGIAFMKKVFAEEIYRRENFFGKPANHLHLVFNKISQPAN